MFDSFLMAGRNRVLQRGIDSLSSSYNGLKMAEQEAQRNVKHLERVCAALDERVQSLTKDNLRLSNQLANTLWAQGIEREAKREVREQCCTPCGKFICSTPYMCQAAKLNAVVSKPRTRVLYYIDSTLSKQWLYIYATNIKDLGEHANGHVMRCQNTEAGRKVATEFVNMMNEQAQVK